MSCRSDADHTVRWRVGRRRLAWRPRCSGIGVPDVPDLEAFLIVLGLIISWYPLKWTCALLATLVVWPWRAVTRRWPVVAYPIDGDEDPRFVRQVRGRRQADATARQWAKRIEEQGRSFQPAGD